ncbi:MAG: universal stress protein [Dehalococcoidia bacterium]|nr:universal stress protein [Dehalococcoidia bacterium]
MIKDLVVHLDTQGKTDVALDYAISVAAAFEAHIAGIAFAYEPVLPPTAAGFIGVEVIEAQRRESEAAAKAMLDRFERACSRAGVSAESRMLSGSLAGAADLFGQIARRFDLSVVEQARPELLSGGHLMIEAALFGSGRPTIIVPYIQKQGLTLDRVLACWDGSRTAARAIGDAMPFLKRAKAVEVIIVTSERGKSDEVPGADMGQHLARHGLPVEVKRLVSPETDVASTILSHAADSGADFIVMGGYGHSRLREFILGGATRGMLEAMTVPVLMSH